MSLALVLVVGCPRDPPGCAARANQQLSCCVGAREAREGSSSSGGCGIVARAVEKSPEAVIC
jgi:hypothetical protein